MALIVGQRSTGAPAAVLVDSSGRLQCVSGSDSVTVSAQASTDTYADCGAALDTANLSSVSYTILNKHATRVLHWKVLAANDAAFAASVTIQAEADIAGTASATYAVAQAPYRYYKVQIQSQDAGLVCTADLYGVAKG